MSEENIQNIPTEEVQETVENTQVDAGKESDSQDINWAKARETMAELSEAKKQSQAEIKALKAEIASMQKAKESQFNGRDEDDLITVKDLKESLAEKEKAYQTELAELRVQAQYPDYSEVLNKYGKTLPQEALEAIKYAPNPYKTAYVLCKQSPAFIKDQMSYENFSDAKKVKENLKKPGNPAKAGNGGLLSNISKYQNMSGDEILALNAKYRR